MKRFLRPEWMVVAALLAAAFLVVFLVPAGQVFSGSFTDMGTQFASWRAFAAASLKAGHLPLWNPYTFSGEPFLGGAQSALFYPPNLIFLFLPLERALNLSMLLQLLILGWGMYRWALHRGSHPLSAALCGLALPLSGPVFPHMYAGHLPNLCAMAWAPWIMDGLEAWWKDGRRSGFFQASAAVCLQIFAGHAQYVFFTGVAAGINALAWSAADRAVRRRALPIVAACYVAAAALAAIQLLPGLAATAESVRQGKVSYGFATEFFLPVENLISFFVPNFFEYPLHDYWGRWYGFELSAFIGASGVMLAALGAAAGTLRRAVRRDLVVAALLLLLALGSETPLYRFLYDYVPGFGQFRGMSKFIFPMALFLLLAVAAGLDVLIRRERVPRRLSLVALAALAAGVVIGVAGASLWTNPGPIIDLMRWARATGTNQVPLEAFKDAPLLAAIGTHVGMSLVIAGAVFLVVGASWAGLGRWPELRWIALAAFALELLANGAMNVTVAPLFVEQTLPDDLKIFLAKNPGDYRILDLIMPQTGADDGFLAGAPDLWGNDPFVSKRYAEFITATQGYDANQTTQYISEFKNLPPIYAILRCRYVIRVGKDAHGNDMPGIYQGAPDPLPHAQLVTDYQVRHDRDDIFRTMASRDFDPRRTVILESEPHPLPAPNPNPGTVRIANLSSDELAVEADVATPAILLITDPYSRDWRAVPLEGSSQQSYEILPADYILRAIPLAAGHHHLLVEYAPPSFRTGRAISLAAFTLWIGAAVGLRSRERRRPSAV
jgi:hypothetical protein